MSIRSVNNRLRSWRSKIHAPNCTSRRARQHARALASALLVVASAAFADSTTSAWNGGTTNWATAANWAGGSPSTTISALFNSAFTYQPQLTANATAQGLYLTSGVGKDVTITGTSEATPVQRALTLAGRADASNLFLVGGRQGRRPTGAVSSGSRGSMRRFFVSP